MPMLYYYMTIPRLIQIPVCGEVSFSIFTAMNIVNIPIPKSSRISLEYSFRVYLEYLEFI